MPRPGSHKYDIKRRRRQAIRGSARGLLAAMAMTGTRTVTAAIAPHEKTPPAAIMEAHAPAQVHRLSAQHREAVTELAHWSYGAAGGVLFGMLPRRFRAYNKAGAIYGLALWLAFELAIGPALGVNYTRHRHALWRIVVAFDHVLYGVVVRGRTAPSGERRGRTRWEEVDG